MECIHQPFYVTWVVDFTLTQAAGNFMLGTHLSDKKIKETFGDGCGRNYANSQSANQNRQDEISRVSAVQNIARGPR